MGCCGWPWLGCLRFFRLSCPPRGLCPCLVVSLLCFSPRLFSCHCRPVQVPTATSSSTRSGPLACLWLLLAATAAGVAAAVAVVCFVLSASAGCCCCCRLLLLLVAVAAVFLSLLFLLLVIVLAVGVVVGAASRHVHVASPCSYSLGGKMWQNFLLQDSRVSSCVLTAPN